MQAPAQRGFNWRFEALGSQPDSQVLCAEEPQRVAMVQQLVPSPPSVAGTCPGSTVELWYGVTSKQTLPCGEQKVCARALT